MIIKFFISLFILISPINVVATTVQPVATLTCTDELQSALDKLQKLEEFQLLYEEVTKEGPIRIKINHHLSKKFDGYWSSSNRTIYITKSRSSSEANFISTILFEMHNALRDKDLCELDRLAAHRKIKKANYVQSVEYIEYENALRTSKLLDKGIKQGLFPRSCYWPISDHFDEHYRIQKKCGHSKWIGQIYDEMG